MDDLEEGEIEEQVAIDPIFVVNPNSSQNDNEFSPVFQSLLSQRNDPLFGSSDVDLRFGQTANVFNDCDERLIPGHPIAFHDNGDQNPSFVAKHPRNANLSSRWPPPDPRHRLQSDMRAGPSVRFRPEVMPRLFRRPDNRRPLLPTPNPHHHRQPIPRFRPPRPPFRPDRPPLNNLIEGLPLRQLVEPLPLVSNWSQKSDPNSDTFVTPVSNSLIPFISDTILPQISSEIEAQKEINSNRNSRLTDRKSNEQLNEKTIVLSANDDIEEVQMQDIQDADEPYDPEQDISLLCPLSPPIIPTEEQIQERAAIFSKDNNIKVVKKDNNSSVNHDNVERIERLQRLLKGQSLADESKSHKKHKTKAKSHKRQSIRMTPQIGAKFVDTMRPVNSWSAKKVVHSKSCKKNHISRRKIKRSAKRQVITKRVNQEKDVDNTSYEELLEEYKRIQIQLKELESEEKSNTSKQRDVDREEKENIKKLMQSDDIFVLNEESKEERVDDDEDESELRRLALESKMKREQKQKEEKEAEEEEQRLRQHLLQSLLDRTKIKESVQTKEDVMTAKQNEEQDSISDTIKLVNEQIVAISPVDSPKPEIQQRPVSQLIINFGDDTSDEETETNTSARNEPFGLDSFLKQARLKSETKRSSGIPPSVLSVTKQKELEKLKAEIARRELNQITDKKLKQNESEWKSAKERLNEKLSKQKLLKTRVIIKRNALRKAQLHARKLQEEFRAATKLVSATASEFHSFNNELKNIEKEMQLEVQNVTKFETECYRMGLRLFGSKYELPEQVSLKRSNSVGTSLSPRKRLKSESKVESFETIADPKKKLHKELVQKLENCSKLLTLKKAHLMRPSSPKKFQSSIKSNQIADQNFEIDLQNAMKSLVKGLLTDVFSDSVISFNCFAERLFTNKQIKPLTVNIDFGESDANSSVNSKKSPLIGNYESILSHLHSYRLIEGQPIPLTCDHWTNNLNPMQEICKFDLLGTCKDDKCLAQHFDRLLLNPYNKIVDFLLYEPKLAGISSDIPERMDMELFDAIKQKLLQFAQKLIDSNPKTPLETHCRKIAEQIRLRFKDSVIGLTRRIPKMFASLKADVPFGDLMYRFNIKDKSFIINQSKISELKISADPDIYFKNRFYAPEGVPISAELETTLASDPHNIQLWIKLAYYHISRGSDHNYADSIDRALNVLSRALDHNRSEPELYEHFLFIYSNRVVRKGEETKFSLFNICQQVVKHCPVYRVRKCVLSLFVDYNLKISVCDEIIRDFFSESKSDDEPKVRSHQLLEIFLYKIHLLLQQNQLDRCISEFTNLLTKNSKQSDNYEHSSGGQHVSQFLTISDRVFLRLCYLYLLIYHKLPDHCFELSKHTFPQLLNKKSFIFNWVSLKNRINPQEMKEYLSSSIDQISIASEPIESIEPDLLALHLNFAEFCAVYENDYKYYEHLLTLTENNSIIWPLIVEHRFKSNRNLSNIIEMLKKSQIYANEDIKLHLKVAKLYFKSKKSLEARQELLFIASKHYNCIISETNLINAFEALLLEDEENNHNFELINARKSKESDSPLIWLSYLFLLEIDGHSSELIDSSYQTALALCLVDKTDSKDLQLLWSNYLEFSVQRIETESDLMNLFGSVRHCCLTISDPTFQSQVIRFFCRLLPDIEKSKALIQLSKLIPQNVDIVMTCILFGLRINRKESVWLFISSLVFELKVRLKCLRFWKIAIGLALERSDHLSAHKLFQLAISLMPYNSSLWQSFKSYETSVKHWDHLNQGKTICQQELNINQF